MVALRELAVELGQLVVDIGRDAVVADLAVDVVGEVEHCGAFGQCDHLALRREDIDFVGKKVELEVVDKLDGVV